MFPSLRYRYTPQTPASRTHPRARRTSMDSTHSKDIDNSKLPHVGASASPSEDASRIGRWTEDEHERFLQGLNLYGREWKKVAEKVLAGLSEEELEQLAAICDKIIVNVKEMGINGKKHKAYRHSHRCRKHAPKHAAKKCCCKH